MAMDSFTAIEINRIFTIYQFLCRKFPIMNLCLYVDQTNIEYSMIRIIDNVVPTIIVFFENEIHPP